MKERLYLKSVTQPEDQDEFASNGEQTRRKIQCHHLNLDPHCICEHATKKNHFAILQTI